MGSLPAPLQLLKTRVSTTAAATLFIFPPSCAASKNAVFAVGCDHTAEQAKREMSQCEKEI
jgi:hypothetical protein